MNKLSSKYSSLFKNQKASKNRDSLIRWASTLLYQKPADSTCSLQAQNAGIGKIASNSYDPGSPPYKSSISDYISTSQDLRDGYQKPSSHAVDGTGFAPVDSMVATLGRNYSPPTVILNYQTNKELSRIKLNKNNLEVAFEAVFSSFQSIMHRLKPVIIKYSKTVNEVKGVWNRYPQLNNWLAGINDSVG